jgi:hypothetical protein
MAKLAESINTILEHPDVKGNQALTLFIKQTVQPGLPKTYKGPARIHDGQNFLYTKITDKPKPKDLNGNELPRLTTRTPFALCVKNLPQFKAQNKALKDAGKAPMDKDQKKAFLKKLVRENPQVKQKYQQYKVEYEEYVKTYIEAQLRNPMANNNKYLLDPNTHEYRQRTYKDDHPDSDDECDEECDIQGSDHE